MEDLNERGKSLIAVVWMSEKREITWLKDIKMPDVFTKEKRSQIMRQIKSSRNKSTELKLIDFFRANKIKGWRRNSKLYGKPDFVFPSDKLIVFVDGCFWHGHDCRKINPKQNKSYWTLKIKRNKQRDNEVTQRLTQMRWAVIRIWECELKNERLLKKKLKSKLVNRNNYL